MSIQALNWAMDMEIGDCGLQCTLILLANYADESGYCYPMQETLQRKTGQSARTLRDKLNRLEQLSLIIRDQRRDKRGRVISDAYHLNLEATRDGVQAAIFAASEEAKRQISPMDNTEETSSGNFHQRQISPPLPANFAGAYKDEPPLEPYSLSNAREPAAAGGLDVGGGGDQPPAPPVDATGQLQALPATAQPVIIVQQAQQGTAIPDMPTIPFEWLVVAQKRGVSREVAEHEFETFKAHYASTGALRASWFATWDKWVLGIPKFTGGSNGKSGTGSGSLLTPAGRRAAIQAEAADDAWDAAGNGVDLLRRGG